MSRRKFHIFFCLRISASLIRRNDYRHIADIRFFLVKAPEKMLIVGSHVIARVVSAFRKQRPMIKAALLVGTQMVTKGLDFGNVSVVGVVNADAIINFPDFRSAERAFNMIEQVSGRAGRKNEDGKVAIQTYSPTHPLFAYLLKHDYKGFYEFELEERRRYNYPPFVRVIYVYVKHKDPVAVGTVANELAGRLRELLGTRVSGPEEPTVGRVQTWYIRRIMLKIETNASVSKVKARLADVRIAMTNQGRRSGATVYYDVDPV